MPVERSPRPWPPSTVDFRGRGWSYEKLDQLLADPEVVATVEAVDKAGRGRSRVFQSARARAWAAEQGRSEEGFALLLLLRWRWFAENNRRSA